MPTALPLDESVAEGDANHDRLHRDANYYLNRVAALLDVDQTVAATTTMLLSAMLSGDLVARFQIRADGTIVHGEPPLTVSTVAGTTTVTVTTTTNHGYGTADVVTISGVAGFIGANGTFTITRTGATTFTLDGVTGSGSYTSGGTVQRKLGATGSSNEGTWNMVLQDTTRDGLVLRGKISSTKNLFLVRDYQAAPIFGVGQVGGAGVYSSLATDLLFTADTTTTRAFAANCAGGVRVAKGDPAGSVETLSIGNATTEPSSNPDGTHLGESTFATAAGGVLWMRGGRPRVRTSAGHEDELLAPVHRRTVSIAAPGGDSTLVIDGALPPTVATTNVTAAADDTASGPGVSYATTASSGVNAGLVSAFGVLQRRWVPYFYCRLRTDASAVTSTRLAAGLVSAEIATDAGPASTGAYTVAAGAWLRYDTAVDGSAFWRAVTSDATTATVTTTSASIAADTSYELVVEVNSAGTSIRFWVGGTLVATHTTNLPGASTALGYTARLRTLAASARALRLGRIAWSAL